MAVGAWVACSSFGRALTGYLTADSLVLAANKTASSITGVSRETSEAIPAHASSTRNEGSGEFLFRASGRHPNIRVPVVETLFLRGLNTRTDGLSVTKLLFHALSDEATLDANVAYHLALVASDALLDLELSE